MLVRFLGVQKLTRFLRAHLPGLALIMTFAAGTSLRALPLGWGLPLRRGPSLRWGLSLRRWARLTLTLSGSGEITMNWIWVGHPLKVGTATLTDS